MDSGSDTDPLSEQTLVTPVQIHPPYCWHVGVHAVMTLCDVTKLDPPIPSSDATTSPPYITNPPGSLYTASCNIFCSQQVVLLKGRNMVALRIQSVI